MQIISNENRNKEHLESVSKLFFAHAILTNIEVHDTLIMDSIFISEFETGDSS